jgi:hypothetical protein
MRSCEFDGCDVQGTVDEMVRASTGEWYCLEHAIVVLEPRCEAALQTPPPTRPTARRVEKERPFPNVKTLGRCPDCGKPAPTIAIPGRATEILEHGCLAHACSIEGCLVARLPEDMVEFPGGAWYCPSHAALRALRHLLTLHRAGYPDMMLLLLTKTVPTILDRFPH